MSSSIDHPSHYNAGIEAIKVIEAWDLGFCLGNALKYLLRAPYKGSELQDLEKALWYASRHLRQFERQSIWRRLLIRFRRAKPPSLCCEDVVCSWKLGPATSRILFDLSLATTHIHSAYALKQNLRAYIAQKTKGE